MTRSSPKTGHAGLLWGCALALVLAACGGGGGGSGGDTSGGSTSGGGATGDRTSNGANGLVGTSDRIQIVGRNLYDTAGEQIVARGPEVVVADSQAAAWIDSAADMGANAIRMLMTLDVANGATPDTFEAVLQRAEQRGMVVWLSLFVWDNTANWAIGSAFGGGNFYALPAPSGTAPCSRNVPGSCYLDVWSRPWLKALVAKHRGSVIIDATQEYKGTAAADTEAGRQEWADAAKATIRWFRSNGYDVPLEVMSNFEGRDLYAIVEKGDEIRAVDTLTVNGQPQTMFGWQAYWAPDWYKTSQGALLLGREDGRITAANAITQFVATRAYPIQAGFDNYTPDMANEYADCGASAAASDVSWLWWAWKDGNVQGSADAQHYVTQTQDGFPGAVKLSTTSARPWTLPVNRARLWPRPGAASAMVGGQLQGSNTSSSAGFVTLSTITAAPTDGQVVTFTNTTPYRYLRYVGPAGSHGQIAELELYADRVRLTGTGFGPSGARTTGATYEKALDRDPTTFFDAADADGASVGLDLGHD